MAEKLSEVYEQYDMNIAATRKGRGATILATDRGCRILEPFRGNITRLEQEHVLKKIFLSEGFSKVDAIIPNRDGQLLTCDRYRQPFVLKQHFNGEECDMKEIADVLRSVRALARLHICGKKAALRFPAEWERHKMEQEKQRLSEIKKALADGEELEKIAHVYDIREAVLEEMLRQPETGYAESKAAEGVPGMVYRDVCETIVRHNKELKKIHKFVSAVKRKNAFENLFLQVFSDYYRQGMDCIAMLGDREMTRRVYERHYGICHGNYNQHNVLLCEDGEAIVHFEGFSKGNQLDDLYQFSRKVMEKNHFALSFLEAILKEYNQQIPLDREDYRYLYILFSYPEKFWKIANSYYNTNKAFLSPKYVEKLEAVILQEKEKKDMLNQFFAFHLG